LQTLPKLVAARKVRLKPLITPRVPIEPAASAYALMMAGKAPYIALLITYPSDRAGSLSRAITS
jgi:threonine dehydrogenase-like Zn-dependent dehydrogenase